MSERYGSPGDLQEILEHFEDWVRTESDQALREMTGGSNSEMLIYLAARRDTLRDVLDFIVRNP